MLYNITTLADKLIAKRIKHMDYVTNGDTVGRYIGTTKRGTHIVAWGENKDDFATIEKLVLYVAKHS